jgi:hypothetical protein
MKVLLASTSVIILTGDEPGVIADDKGNSLCRYYGRQAWRSVAIAQPISLLKVLFSPTRRSCASFCLPTARSVSSAALILNYQH